MITAKQVRDLISPNPFKPFRIHLSDDSYNDLINRDAVIVERNTLDIGINLDRDGKAEIDAAVYG